MVVGEVPTGIIPHLVELEVIPLVHLVHPDQVEPMWQGVVGQMVDLAVLAADAVLLPLDWVATAVRDMEPEEEGVITAEVAPMVPQGAGDPALQSRTSFLLTLPGFRVLDSLRLPGRQIRRPLPYQTRPSSHR